MCGSRGGGGGQGVKNHKFIGFPSNNNKLPRQHSMMGPYWPANQTPFQWHFADRPIVAHF